VEVISEIHHITDGGPLHDEVFPIGSANHEANFRSRADCLSCVLGEIVAIKLFPHQRWFVGADRQTLEKRYGEGFLRVSRQTITHTLADFHTQLTT